MNFAMAGLLPLVEMARSRPLFLTTDGTMTGASQVAEFASTPLLCGFAYDRLVQLRIARRRDYQERSLDEAAQVFGLYCHAM